MTMCAQTVPGRTAQRLSLARILLILTRRRALRRDRLRLAFLDDHLLQDVGISREEARREAERLDWDAPAHWSRAQTCRKPGEPRQTS